MKRPKAKKKKKAQTPPSTSKKSKVARRAEERPPYRLETYRPGAHFENWLGDPMDEVW